MRVPNHAKQYQQFFMAEKIPVRGVSITYRENASRKGEGNCDCFALFSNTIKDMIEKSFDNLKDPLQMKRSCVSTEENLEGNFFVHNLALIVLSCIDTAKKNHGLEREQPSSRISTKL